MIRVSGVSGSEEVDVHGACRFLMVFMCLLLSVFSTIDQYEDMAGVVVFYLVSQCLVLVTSCII